MGIDRFLYAKEYLTGFWGSMSSLLALFLPIDILFFLKFKKKLGIIALVLYYIYLFWIGIKFGMYLIISYWLIIPFIKGASKKQLKKVLITFTIIFCVLLGLVNLQGKLIYNRTGSESAEYLVSRVSQQGQMWWGIYGQKQAPHPSEIKDELRTFFTDKTPVDYNYGIYKMMQKIIPPRIFYNKVYNGNSRYAFSTQASLYYYYGFIGVLLWSALSAILYSWVIQSFIEDFKKGNVVFCILLTRIFLIMNSVLLQSDFNKLFSFDIVGCFIIVAGGHYFYKRKDLINGLRNRRNRL